MTVAALEALELDRCLRARDDMVPGLPRRFWRRAARIVDAAWMLATSEDLRYPECEGHRPPGMALLQAYLERVHHGAEHDPHVLASFYRVLNMLQPPSALLAPAMMARVLVGHRARRRPLPLERASAPPGA